MSFPRTTEPKHSSIIVTLFHTYYWSASRFSLVFPTQQAWRGYATRALGGGVLFLWPWFKFWWGGSDQWHRVETRPFTSVVSWLCALFVDVVAVKGFRLALEMGLYLTRATVQYTTPILYLQRFLPRTS